MSTATAKSERVFFDLGNIEGLKDFNAAYEAESSIVSPKSSDICSNSDITEYIRNGQLPALSVRSRRKSSALLFNVADYTVFVINGIIYEGSYFPTVAGHSGDITAKDYRDDIARAPSYSTVIGVIVDAPIGEFKKTLIRCGDEDANYLVNELGDDHGYPTLSFAVLLRFYPGTEVSDIADWFVSGRLKLVDYMRDHTQKLSAIQKKAFAAADRNGNKKLEPIGPLGYSRVGNDWHRSATCLIYDTKNKISIVVGQDEGSYFGCELPTNPKTIKDAFNDLTPEGARGTKHQRQGEWFVVFVADKDVPKHVSITNDPDGIGIRFVRDPNVDLPKETTDSNDHTICGYSEICITPQGQVYAKGGTLEHDQHRSLNWKSDQWVTFLKNTAKRSFSVEGVD